MIKSWIERQNPSWNILTSESFSFGSSFPFSQSLLSIFNKRVHVLLFDITGKIAIHGLNFRIKKIKYFENFIIQNISTKKFPIKIPILAATVFPCDFAFVIYWRILLKRIFKEMLQDLKSWNRKNISQFFRDKMLKLWKRIFQVEGFLGQAYSLDDTNPNRTLLFWTRRLHELRLFNFHRCFLRQVSGINKLIKMSTYRLAFGDSVGWTYSAKHEIFPHTVCDILVWNESELLEQNFENFLSTLLVL